MQHKPHTPGLSLSPLFFSWITHFFKPIVGLTTAISVVFFSSLQPAHADTFSAAGPYSYTVPAGVTQVQVVVAGAGGGGGFYDGGNGPGGSGGSGAKITATVNVTPGQQISGYVGGGGAGGTNSYGYRGGNPGACSGSGPGGAGAGTGGAGGRANCGSTISISQGTDQSGGGAGGGGSSSLSVNGVILQAGGGGGGAGGGYNQTGGTGAASTGYSSNYAGCGSGRSGGTGGDSPSDGGGGGGGGGGAVAGSGGNGGQDNNINSQINTGYPAGGGGAGTSCSYDPGKLATISYAGAGGGAGGAGQNTASKGGSGYVSITVLSVAPAISVSKAAVPSTLVVGGSNQQYTITLTVANAASLSATSITDTLPAGVTTAGVITTNKGTLSGCPGIGATSLGACSLSAGVSGTVLVTVPVNIAATVATSITNSVAVSGGGDPSCNGTGNCTGSTTNSVVDAVDDSDTKAPGVATSTNVSGNDKFPTNSTFTSTGGTCSGRSPASPGTNTTGVLSYTLPVGSANCTVIYQLCAPSPNAAVCDTATLTVTTIAPMPTLTVTQRLLVAAPYIFKPPVTFSYSGNNGWTTQPITSNKENLTYSAGPQTLAALNTDTTVQIVQTSPNWGVVNFRCTDSNYRVSGNQPGNLATNALYSITIPAAAVRASAAITCAILMSYKN